MNEVVRVVDLRALMGGPTVATADLQALIANQSIVCTAYSQPSPVPGPFRLVWPTPGPTIVTQEYGINPQWYKSYGLPGHEGIDMRAVKGTLILVMADGVVTRVEDNAASGPYGKHVRVEHDCQGEKYRTVYAHFMQTKVAVGEAVVAGQVVGLADNTGNSYGAHLHITLKHIGHGSPWLNKSDIVNPTPYMLDLFPGKGWYVDVGGNLRSTPEVTASNIIRWLPAGPVVQALDFGGEGGDWWKVETGLGIVGWFWNPGYKLRMAK